MFLAVCSISGVQFMFVSWRHRTSASTSRVAWVMACQLRDPFLALMVFTFREIILSLLAVCSMASMSSPQYLLPVALCSVVW